MKDEIIPEGKMAEQFSDESLSDKIMRERAERAEKAKKEAKLIHPSQITKSLESSGDPKFDAMAELIISKLDSHSAQLGKQTEKIEAQGEQIDEMKEAIGLMMQTYFDQIKRFSENFSKIFDDGKEVTSVELVDRVELLTETISLAEPSMFRMGDRETQAIYQRIMPGIREELKILQENIRKENILELQELGGELGTIMGDSLFKTRSEIQKSLKSIESMATNITKKIEFESKDIKRASNPNSRNSYLTN